LSYRDWQTERFLSEVDYLNYRFSPHRFIYQNINYYKCRYCHSKIIRCVKIVTINDRDYDWELFEYNNNECIINQIL